MRGVLLMSVCMTACVFCVSHAVVDPFAIVGLQEGLIFHAGFDGSVKANYAAGNAEPARVSGRLIFAEGVKGESLLLGRNGAALSYFREDNLNAPRGSIALWLQAVDWVREDKLERRLGFLRRDNGSWDGSLNLRIGKRYIPDEASKSCFVTGRGLVSVNYIPVREWENGAWHHIVLTWEDTGRFTWFIDGKVADSGMLEKPFTGKRTESETFCLGDKKAEEHIAVDEFKIWNRPLTASEVSALYSQ